MPGKIEGKNYLINTRNRSANGAFRMAKTGIGVEARSLNHSYRNRRGLTKKEIKR
jgi:hypothetical protein